MSVTVEKQGNRIVLRSTRPTPGLKETVPGANFNKGTHKTGGPYWSLPLSMTACRALRERFGAELQIGDDLWAWAKAEVAHGSKMKSLAAQRDATLEFVPALAPALAEAMERRTYQRVGARFIADAKRCILADDPGLGKTLEALGGIIESGVPGPYLVVAPKTAVETVWAREIPRWLGSRHRVVTVPDGRVKRDGILNAWARAGLDGRTWLVIHPEMVRTKVYWVCGVCRQETPRKGGKVELACGHDANLRAKDRVDHTFPQLFGTEFGAVICDESDRAVVRSNKPTQTRTGMEMLDVRSDGLKISMSGTPMRGRPHLLWGHLNWLDEKRYPSYWNWLKSLWETKQGQFGGVEIGSLRNEAELWQSLDSILLRRTKAEVAPDLPPKTYVGTPAFDDDADSPHGVWLPMDSAQEKQYKQMMAESVADLADGTRVEAVGILAELTRLKQFAGCAGSMVTQGNREAVFVPSLPSNKFEYLVQLLDELGYPDDPQTKVVVVSQFTSVLELFARELPSRLQALSKHPRTPIPASMHPVMLTGSVSSNRREANIDAMNAPVGSGAHIMFLNTKAGGVAITLDVADVMVILDETWIPDDQEQVEDRIHRVSRPRPVFYHYLRSLGTVDLSIALTNAEREWNTKRVLDGRRGVEYAKSVLRRTQELR